jgi:FKBP-type peptidyl-prolyl cis-trans isomerase (trigger factor)
MERAKSEGDSMSLSSGRDAPDLELGLVGTQDGESGKADGKLVEVVVPQEMDDEELPGDKSP